MKNYSSQVHENRVWATIGKLGVFVSLVGALFTLYGQVNPDRARVIATCRVNEIFTRPSVVRSTDSQPSLEARKSVGGVPPMPLEASLGLKIAPGDIVLENFRLRNPQIALQCDVVNTGRQEAKEVVFDFPFFVDAARADRETIALQNISKQSISIGSLRPNAKIDLIVWADTAVKYFAEREDGYSLSFSGGIGTVRLPQLAFGWVASVVLVINYLVKNTALMVFLVVFLLLMTSSFFTSFRMGRKKIDFEVHSDSSNSTSGSNPDTTAAAGNSPKFSQNKKQDEWRD